MLPSDSNEERKKNIPRYPHTCARNGREKESEWSEAKLTRNKSAQSDLACTHIVECTTMSISGCWTSTFIYTYGYEKFTTLETYNRYIRHDAKRVRMRGTIMLRTAYSHRLYLYYIPFRFHSVLSKPNILHCLWLLNATANKTHMNIRSTVSFSENVMKTGKKQSWCCGE